MPGPNAPHANPARAAPTPSARAPRPATQPAATPQPAQPRPAAHANPAAPPPDLNKIVMPVRYAAWLRGDLGEKIQKAFVDDLDEVDGLRVSVLPKAFVIEASEAPGPLLETVKRAAERLEQQVQERYPVFHHDFGPVWTGTLQAVFA